MKKFLSFIALVLLCGSSYAQVTPAVKDGGGLTFRVGGTINFFKPDYGTNWLLGPGVFVDFNITPTIGIEGEARWLRWNQADKIHEDTYLIGPRYELRKEFFGYKPYAKFLLGVGRFNFYDDSGHGGYGMFALGGGLDKKISEKWRWRAIDFEYQRWPSIQPGIGSGNSNSKGISPIGVSTGISYRFF